MKPARTRPAPNLADYVKPRTVSTSDRSAWVIISAWQREGLVSVKPISGDAAIVEITAKGREAK